MPVLTIEAPPLHVSQNRVRQSPARFKVLACGRRWGKTRLGAALCFEAAASGGRAWWIAPSYKMANVGWRLISQLAKQIPGTAVNKSERRIIMPGGGEMSVRSADNPDSLRGESLDFAVLDECAFMAEETWLEAIRPSLADRHGRAMFISTPKGHNWFWRLYQVAQSNPDYQAWQIPTSDNPYIADSEIEAARTTLPERIFEQEFLARFLDDAGGVFRRVAESAVLLPLDQPQTNAHYVAGVDVADSMDFTVISIMDANTKEQVYLDRFNRVGYEVLEDRLQAAYNRFGCQAMVIESNSIGQPVIDHLYSRGMAIIPFHTSSSTKQPLIQALQSAFEHGSIKIINDPVQVGELQAYESKRLAAGFSYSAPAGMHDDTVMSLALAWYAIVSNDPTGGIHV